MIKKKIRIQRECKDVKKYLSALKEEADEIVIRISDWEENFSQIYKCSIFRLPYHVRGKKVVVTSRSQILDFADSMGIDIQPYRLTREEGSFWIAKKIGKMEGENGYKKSWSFSMI